MIYASAPGKINLFFEVGPLRPDGFHSVTSIYQSLAIRQRVGVTPAETWVVTTTGELPTEQLNLVPKGEENLVVIAAKKLAEFAGIEAQPMRFETIKQVPVAAGLAGGSADAAAALLALNEHWSLGVEMTELSEVAAKVGSDVPFALLGGTALGVDTGIELERLSDMPTKHIVLLVSPHGLGTKEVFGEFDRLSPNGEMSLSPEEAKAALSNGTLPIGKNALWGPAVDLRPELAQYAGLVSGQQGFLTGSGPTLYFLTDTKEQADEVAAKLSDLGHFTISTQTDQVGARLD
ncbi:4-(cytidine 5'-diphospho)-2-C-methyl-D-erythritol kinase [Aquiluna sp.]|nr:4-(cytidine 5'-diphospho)-2-C-methyl-D-erythritol kinase [Aquiluna sp.]